MKDCLPDQLYSVYVDGESSAEDIRLVESHLIGCEKCRGVILALGDEAIVIADVLHDRHRLADRNPVVRAPARTRAKGLAIGLGPTLAIAALLVTVLGWLLETRLPAGTSWMNPMKWIGVYEMIFDLIFLLRDRAPGLIEFTVALGAMLSVASILTFLVSAISRLLLGTSALLLLLTASMFTSPPVANAFESRTSKGDLEVAMDETVEESLFISAEVVSIDGTVDGDLVVLAERIVLRGVVHGNVFAIGREVEVSGVIDGSLHTAGERVTIEGEVRQNLYGAAETMTLHERGRIRRDVTLAGESVHMDGSVGRDLVSTAERVNIRGTVGRNASTASGRLTLDGNVRIVGDLEYSLPDEAEPEIMSGAEIGGETTAGDLLQKLSRPVNRWANGHFYMRMTVFLVSAFLVGMVLQVLRPDVFLVDLETSSDFLRSMGYGAIGLVCIPIALILCFVTVVGIPIGVIGVFLYVTILFLSVIVVASVVGTSIAASAGFEGEGLHAFGMSLLVGLLVVVIAMNLPFVGGILRLLVVMVGVGMIIIAAIDAWQHRLGDGYAG